MAHRITRLQVIFLIIVFILVFSICKRFYCAWQIASKREPVVAMEPEKPFEVLEDVGKTPPSQSGVKDLAQIAKQQIAVSGEKIKIKRKNGFNVLLAADILRNAKNSYTLCDYENAIAYARRASDIANTLSPPKRGIYIVKKGDNLWNISKKQYKKGSNWYYIWKANKEKISDFDLIYSRQRIVIPDLYQQNQS